MLYPDFVILCNIFQICDNVNCKFKYGNTSVHFSNLIQIFLGHLYTVCDATRCKYFLYLYYQFHKLSYICTILLPYLYLLSYICTISFTNSSLRSRYIARSITLLLQFNSMLNITPVSYISNPSDINPCDFLLVL